MSDLLFSDFEKIVLDEIPLIDVRAPIEYQKGSVKNAINLPIMNDEERHEVGTCYSQKGNELAIELGHKLVSGEVKESRIEAWKQFVENHQECYIFCARGGLRSKLSQQCVNDATSKNIKRLEGGFKNFRNYLINQLDPSEIPATPILLGGCTGAGKTILLNQLESSIDLEGIGNHRGSSFGNKIMPQPTQVNFENDLAYALIQHRSKNFKFLILEDEGRNIGKCFLPKAFVEHVKKSNLVILEPTLDERIKNTMEEYIISSQSSYIKEFGEEQGLETWKKYIDESLYKLQKKLGLEKFNELKEILNSAYLHQIKTNNKDYYINLIELLLTKYYDPMYKYQIEQNKERIIFSGNKEEASQYLTQNYLVKSV